MSIYNIRCHVCNALCQNDTIRTFKIDGNSHAGLRKLGIAGMAIDICELCLWPETEPIPFTVTEKGKAYWITQGSKEKENA